MQEFITSIAEKIIRTDIDIYVIHNLRYYLISLLQFLSTHQARLIVLLNTPEQVTAVTKYFNIPITILTDEDFLKGDYTNHFYDYMFFLGQCVPSDWKQYNKHLVIDNQTSHPDESLVISTLPIPIPEITYNAIDYGLNDLNDLFLSMARQAAEMAYITPKSRILLLLPTSVEVESLFNILQKAQLPIPVNTLDWLEDNLQPEIIVATRESALLFASQLNVTYTIDSMLRQAWFLTWTQGRRNQYIRISKEEAKQSNTFGGIIHRMISESYYNLLQPKSSQKLCLWRDWLLRENINSKPIQAEKCWLHLIEPNTSTISPKLKNFLLSEPLGLRPALVLWKWAQDGMALFPMLCLIALIDSYGPPYFQYPLRSPDMEFRDDMYQRLRQKHAEKYFSTFIGDNDLETLLKMWLNLLDFAGGFEDVPRYMQRWALQYSIRADKIAEVYAVIVNLITFFQQEGFTITKGPFEINIFLRQARPYIEDVYADRIVTQTIPGGAIYGSNGNYYLRTGTEYSPVIREYPKQLYALVVQEENSSSQAGSSIHGDIAGESKIREGSKCLLWIGLPKREEQEEIEIVIAA